MFFAFTRFSRASMQIPAEMFVGYLGTISCAVRESPALVRDVRQQPPARRCPAGCLLQCMSQAAFVTARFHLPVRMKARGRGVNPETAAAETGLKTSLRGWLDPGRPRAGAMRVLRNRGPIA